jgi:predicted TIM-barrel fold metal-dependent hydrolase
LPLLRSITALVESIPLADTHEHLLEEPERLSEAEGERAPDFSALFAMYSSHDLDVAGMPSADRARFRAPQTPFEEKWRLLKPYYERCRNTGYLQAARIAVQRLYGEDDLTDDSIGRINEKYLSSLKPGMTRRILKEVANIDHCQVNYPHELPFKVTEQPELLLQDISLNTLAHCWSRRSVHEFAGMEVKSLADYHALVDAVFDKYAASATAVKNQANYFRRLDFADVKAEEISSAFEAGLADIEKISSDQATAIQDHLFHYGVRKATEYGLPVKIHCGYLAGVNRMPLGRLSHNGADICELLMTHPRTSFVFMHTNYPYQDELISVCKHYTNAHADMCWAWGINPAAAMRFLREFLMAVPASKILTFGGDVYLPELTVGHAAIARNGIARVLSGLVEEGWLREADVEPLANRIMRGNAREIFRIEEKFGI